MMKRFFIIFFVLLFTSKAFAANSDCNAGSALDSYFCYSDELKVLNNRISNSLREADVELSRKDEGSKEKRERLKSAQRAWEHYRQDTCSFDYYTSAPVHPPSQSLEITLCRIKMGKIRLDEIKQLYGKNEQ